MGKPGRHNGYRVGGLIGDDESGHGRRLQSATCTGIVRNLYVRIGSPPRLICVGEICSSCREVMTVKRVLHEIHRDPVTAKGWRTQDDPWKPRVDTITNV